MYVGDVHVHFARGQAQAVVVVHDVQVVLREQRVVLFGVPVDRRGTIKQPVHFGVHNHALAFGFGFAQTLHALGQPVFRKQVIRVQKCDGIPDRCAPDNGVARAP